MLSPIQKLLAHASNERSESDSAYFAALMYTGEAVMKLAIAGLVAAVQDDREAHRYRLESRLVRANSLGEWDGVLDDVLTGPSAQFLDRGAQATTQALTERVGEGSWQIDALRGLAESIDRVGLDSLPSATRRVQGRTWFKEFVRLRNGTRGHGAPPASAWRQEVLDRCQPELARLRADERQARDVIKANEPENDSDMETSGTLEEWITEAKEIAEQLQEYEQPQMQVRSTQIVANRFSSVGWTIVPNHYQRSRMVFS